eukprot:GILI01034981.1.p2 GENE.GILI01034981.1~~GILI01034981.1.p2  ORF type:complete len:100 (+),score=8.54 GILI01034981.1:123-422(+)
MPLRSSCSSPRLPAQNRRGPINLCSTPGAIDLIIASAVSSRLSFFGRCDEGSLIQGIVRPSPTSREAAEVVTVDTPFRYPQSLKQLSFRAYLIPLRPPG